MNNRLIKASGWYFISSLFLKGIGLLTTPIFARIMSEHDYGMLENFNALLSIMMIISSLSFSSTLVTARYDFSDKLSSYIKTGLVSTSVLNIVIFVVFLIAHEEILLFFQLNDAYFLIVFLVILFNPAFEIYIYFNQLSYKYKNISALNVILGILGVVLSFVFIFLMNDDVFARALGSQLPFICVGLFIYFHYMANKNIIEFEFIKYAFPICLPVVVHSFSGALLNSSDRIMITNIRGAEDNAFYSLASSCGQLAYILWMALNTAFIPWLSENMKIKRFKDIYLFSKKYILVYFTLIVGVILISPDVLYILGGHRYSEAKFAVPALIFGYTFLFLYSMFVNAEQIVKKTRGMAITTSLCALINILLNYIFIPMYGYIAASYTTMIGYLIMFISHHIIILKLKLNNLFDIKLMYCVAFISVVLSFVCPFLYNFYLLRLIALVIYIVALIFVFYRNKDNILALLKNRN